MERLIGRKDCTFLLKWKASEADELLQLIDEIRHLLFWRPSFVWRKSEVLSGQRADGLKFTGGITNRSWLRAVFVSELSLQKSQQ
jgi:hypothetical protein